MNSLNLKQDISLFFLIILINMAYSLCKPQTQYLRQIE